MKSHKSKVLVADVSANMVNILHIKMKTLVLYSIIALALAPVILGQNSEVESANQNSELVILKARFQEQSEFQSDLLTTVYWSLGTIGTVAALLVGFSWFVNFRVLEKEKASLEARLQVYASATIDDLSKEILQQIDKKGSDSEKRITATLSSLEDRIKKVANDQLTPFLSEIQSRLKSLENTIGKAELKLLKIEYAEILNERESWNTKGVHINSLRCLCDAFGKAKDAKIGYYDLKKLLDIVAKDVALADQKIQKPIDASIVARLDKGLSEIEGDLALIAEKLRPKVNALLGE